MSYSIKQINTERLQQIIKLLKFIITLDDLEIIKATIESIIEVLQEENNSKLV